MNRVGFKQLHDAGQVRRQCVVLGPKVPCVIVSFVRPLKNTVWKLVTGRDICPIRPANVHYLHMLI